MSAELHISCMSASAHTKQTTVVTTGDLNDPALRPPAPDVQQRYLLLLPPDLCPGPHLLWRAASAHRSGLTSRRTPLAKLRGPSLPELSTPLSEGNLGCLDQLQYNSEHSEPGPGLRPLAPAPGRASHQAGPVARAVRALKSQCKVCWPPVTPR